MTLKKWKEKRKQKQQAKRTQDLIPIKTLYHQAILTKNQNLIAGIRVGTMNLELMGEEEKIELLEDFGAIVSSIPCKFQIEVLAEPVDLSDYVEDQKQKIEEESNANRQLLRRGYVSYLETSSQVQNTLKKAHYLLLSAEVREDEGSIRDGLETLLERTEMIRENLTDLSEDGLECHILNANEIVQMLQVHFNNYQARINRFKEVSPPYITISDAKEKQRTRGENRECSN
ncbi:hypothetical protein [Bacillus sp. TL12]|uniref:hypothetical protein n=1 Tax=Bacillus sp. TL12 TaxID=2894756 RepID=UPI001F5258A5|nr:hypothetical protein [Bacillus sp. TL12]MCI0767292.1 hypothetical protein [Bacillus sp. TL12]